MRQRAERPSPPTTKADRRAGQLGPIMHFAVAAAIVTTIVMVSAANDPLVGVHREAHFSGLVPTAAAKATTTTVASCPLRGQLSLISRPQIRFVA